jgi:hypothetical protein
MSDDLPDDEPATDDVAEQPERLALPSLDSFGAVNNLIALAIDPKAVKRHLRQLHDALAAVTAGQDKLAAERTAFDEYERTTRAELTAQAAKLREGQVALATAKDAREDNLAERERRIRELEAAWKFVGEDNVDDVARGFRAAEFSALMKARAAHGIGRDHGLDDIAKTMADWQPPTRNVNHDPQGVPFAAHTSLSRSESAPPGVRIRGRKPSAPVTP